MKASLYVHSRLRRRIGCIALLCLWLLGAVGVRPTLAQPSPIPTVPPPAHFRTLTTRDGLSHPAVFAISQDALGFMWLGTVTNLDRFDGNELRSFSPAGTAQGASCTAPKLSAYVDRNDRVWIGTLAHGACQYDTRTGVWRTYLTGGGSDQRLNALSVRDFVQDAEGAIWMATNAGLAYLAPGSDTPRFYRDDPDAAQPELDDLMAVALESSGRLWLGARGGLAVFDPATQQFSRYRHDPADSASLSSDRVFDVAVDRQGQVWAATWDGGLNRLDPQTGEIRRFRHDDGDPGSLSSDQLMKVMEDHAGRIWIGAYDGGLNLFDPQTGHFVHYRHDPTNPWSLGNDHVVALFEDHAGYLWIGTEGGGVSILDLNPPPFTFYRQLPDAATTQSPGLVTALAEARDGALWIGANAGGLSRLDRTTGASAYFRHDPDDPASLASDAVSSVLLARDDMLWVGTAGGLSRFDAARGAFTHYRHDPAAPDSLTDDAIYALAEDPDGSLWVGAYGGLNHLDPASGQVTRTVHNPGDPASLSANTVRVLLIGDGDDLWIGTQTGGLNRLARTTGQITRYRSDPRDPATLSGANITALARDASGHIWIGAEGDGLNRLDPQTGVVTRFGLADGLPDLRILALAFVEDATGAGPGALWMSTGTGLSRFDLARQSFQSYGAYDGLPESGFVTYSHYQSAQGELFFGALEGVVAFDPVAFGAPSRQPTARVTELFIESKPAAIFASDAITLPAEVQAFTLAFAAPGYWGTPHLRFRYRLQGYDNDWREAHTSQRAATYTNLRPATYRFEVQAAGRDGGWQPGASILAVTLAPEWWEVWWVMPTLVTTCGGLGLALLAGGFQTRLRQSKRQNQLLEQQVAERTTELSMLLAVSRSITSEHDLGPLLVHILNDVHATLAHTGSLVLLHNGSEAPLIAYRLLQNEATLTESRVSNSLMTPLLDALHSGKPFSLCDVPGAAALAPLLPAPQQTSVWLGARLHARAEIIGVLLLFDHSPGRFDAAMQPSLQRFANQVAIAVDNARLYAESQQLAVEIERGRLSRELHDSVTQFLHSISLHADASTRALALGKPEISADNMREVQRLARAAIHELRTLIFDLRSSEMQQRGLGVALQAYLDNVVMRSGLVVKREIDYPRRLPEPIEFEVYRIAQEVLTNVAKHAHASSVAVMLSEETAAQGERRVRLAIADNGAGFDVQNVRSGAIGLNSMAERAQQIGARLTIESAPGCGTTVQVEVAL